MKIPYIGSEQYKPSSDLYIYISCQSFNNSKELILRRLNLTLNLRIRAFAPDGGILHLRDKCSTSIGVWCYIYYRASLMR